MLPQPVVGAAVLASLDVLVEALLDLPESALPDLSSELPQATKAMAATSITSRAMALLILISPPPQQPGATAALPAEAQIRCTWQQCIHMRKIASRRIWDPNRCLGSEYRDAFAEAAAADSGRGRVMVHAVQEPGFAR